MKGTGGERGTTTTTTTNHTTTTWTWDSGRGGEGKTLGTRIPLGGPLALGRTQGGNPGG